MRNQHKIYGILMRPVSMTNEENEKTIMSADAAISGKFLDTYNHHVGTMQVIAESAKIYILNNWKKVKDWSDINVEICNGNDGKETTYYKHNDTAIYGDNNTGRSIKEIFDKIGKDRHNPMPQISEVVLDSSDGDFSINLEDGTKHWWIYDSAVIVIADYIEEQLSK